MTAAFASGRNIHFTRICILFFVGFIALSTLYESAPAAEVVVKRDTLLEDLLIFYSNADSLDSRPKVSFDGETGDDFGGLTKEMFTSFWKEAYKSFFHGENCKVPFIPLYRLRKESSSCVANGRVLTHMAGLTRSLPCQIARSTFINLVFNATADEECLLSDLLLFVTEGERRLLKLALGDFTQIGDKQMEALVDFFMHNDFQENPQPNEIRQQLAAIATNILVTKAEPFVKLMSSGLPQVHIDMFLSNMTTMN